MEYAGITRRQAIVAMSVAGLSCLLGLGGEAMFPRRALAASYSLGYIDGVEAIGPTTRDTSGNRVIPSDFIYIMDRYHWVCKYPSDGMTWRQTKPSGCAYRWRFSETEQIPSWHYDSATDTVNVAGYMDGWYLEKVAGGNFGTTARIRNDETFSNIPRFSAIFPRVAIDADGDLCDIYMTFLPREFETANFPFSKAGLFGWMPPDPVNHVTGIAQFMAPGRTDMTPKETVGWFAQVMIYLGKTGSFTWASTDVNNLSIKNNGWAKGSWCFVLSDIDQPDYFCKHGIGYAGSKYADGGYGDYRFIEGYQLLDRSDGQLHVYLNKTEGSQASLLVPKNIHDDLGDCVRVVAGGATDNTNSDVPNTKFSGCLAVIETLTSGDDAGAAQFFWQGSHCWTKALVAPDLPKYGAMDLTKRDEDTADSTPQGDASLIGGQFRLYRKDNSSFYCGLDEVAALPFSSLTAEGEPTVINHIEAGTYYVQEVEPPLGYKLPANPLKSVTLHSWKYYVDSGDGDIVNHVTFDDPIIRGGFTLDKVDADTGLSEPQGDASFAGVGVKVTNRSLNPVYIDGRKFAVGEICASGSLSGDSGAGLRIDNLPYGTYDIEEDGDAVLVGYDIGGLGASTNIKGFQVRSENVSPLGAKIADPVWRGGVRIKKVDSDQSLVGGRKHKVDLDWDSPQGNGSLGGAEFKIFSISRSYVVVNGRKYDARYHRKQDIVDPATAADCLCTLVADETGRASTEIDTLPYGTYVIFETKPPEGYKLNESFKSGVEFQIREKGAYVAFEGGFDFLPW